MAPIRILLLMKRKEGLTPAEFKDFYENKHIALVKSLLGETFPKVYERTYVEHIKVEGAAEGDTSDAAWIPNVLYGSQFNADFDAYTRITYDNQDEFNATFDRFTDPENIKLVHASEDKFLDQSRVRTVYIDGPYGAPNA